MPHLVHVHRAFFHFECHAVWQLVEYNVPVNTLPLLERRVRLQLFKAGFERFDEALTSFPIKTVLMDPDRVDLFLRFGCTITLCRSILGLFGA